MKQIEIKKILRIKHHLLNINNTLISIKIRQTTNGNY